MVSRKKYMTGILNARILASLGMIVFVAAIAASSTGAFFSDTETSTGNTFTAGDIDLQIDNESYAVDYNIPSFQGTQTGALVANPANSWTLADLVAGTHKFFDFTDLKPGDLGEDTISIHVGSNNAWMCAAARITEDADNSITEPEDNEGGPAGQDGTADGDLDSALQFAFWHDDGDNVLEVDEFDGGAGIFLGGTLASMGAAGSITLADSDESILGGTNPIPGGTTFYIGKAWCFGTLAGAPVAQDGATTQGPLDPELVNPAGPRGTGVTCDGSSVNNLAQTDSVEGDMQFYAVQSRNNTSFQCEGWQPTWPATEQTLTVTKAIVGATGGETADNFSFQIDAGAVIPFEADGTNVVSVAAGAHDVSEVADPDFGTVISGDCAADGTVNVPVSGNASCTITNTFDGVEDNE